MQLIEVLRHPALGEDDQATIYVQRPWSPSAEAIVISPAPISTEAVERGGVRYEYFLEGFVARDLMTDLATMPEEQRCERVVLYAETDA